VRASWCFSWYFCVWIIFRGEKSSSSNMFHFGRELTDQLINWISCQLTPWVEQYKVNLSKS
jgi:hypothetical protein